MSKSILRGSAVGVLVLGLSYFISRNGAALTDTITHIPDIIFNGYQPATLAPGFAREFIMWLGAETLLCLMIMPERDEKEK